ncbi:MAG TPA: proton-conducting transporter membrane subunit [Acidimicrobiia bacterium]|nr:proton-conducting transporter membrane subunit [Acidimicrobiia bacterium]
MPLLAVLLPVVPVLAAALAAGAGWRALSARCSVAAAALVLAGGGVLAAGVLADGPVGALGGLVRVDALSVFMVLVIGAVALVATGYGVSYIDRELAGGHTTPAGARTYAVLVQLFIAAMLVAVVADNLGVVWVAVEATTITTAFLVGHRRTRHSLEASWKYVIIGSVGVALAFLGTALVYFASRHGGGDAEAALNWSELTRHATQLDPGVMRLAVGLLVIGFGTKVGLAPLHTWLPDAHSQAPAPVSALMSGVLLSVAFYALLRYKVIADAALGAGYVRGLLLGAGLLSLAVASSLLIAQRDYKRLLAYSSIEHMGLVAVGAAVGTRLAIAAVLLHILGHGLAKAVLFCGSGELLLATGSTRIADVDGALVALPVVGPVFGLGLLALLGLPPFSLFASELALSRAGFADGLGWAIVAALGLLLVVFAAVARHAQRLLLGASSRPGAEPPPWSATVPLIGGIAACAALGVTVWPIERLLHAAAAVVAP